MRRFSDDFLYSDDHLWFRQEDDGRLQVGLTEPHLTVLGRPDEVEFLAIEGQAIKVGQPLARLSNEDDEWQITSPVAGKILACNVDLADSPELMAEDPYDEGWLLRLEPASEKELDNLLTASEYDDHVAEELADLDEDDEDYDDDEGDEDDYDDDEDEEDDYDDDEDDY